MVDELMLIYISITDGDVIDGWGSSPISDTSLEININSNHPMLSSLPRTYKYVDGEIIPRSAEELEEEIIVDPPTEVEILRSKLERITEEKKMSDLALLELSEIIMNGGI